ncbi:MAG: YwaF family protein [Clostridia bacterium]|nr:YwaF family protein [Clostridia bacterium]
MNAFLETLRRLLAYTAWEMEVPKAYGPLHLSFMVIGFTLAFFLAWRLRNVGERGNRAIMLTIGIFLLVSEVYKQLMYELVVEPEPGYRWGIFPFQLCSIPMYFCLIVPFLKPGRVRQCMYDFMMTYNLLGGFLAFFEPSGLLHGHWTLTLHALVWHMMLVFVGVYIGLSGRGGIEKENYIGATVTFLILCVIAFAINCAFWEISERQINMFFVGPANNTVIVYSSIAEYCGWYVATAVYIPTVAIAALIFFFAFRLYGKKCRRT